MALDTFSGIKSATFAYGSIVYLRSPISAIYDTTSGPFAVINPLGECVVEQTAPGLQERGDGTLSSY